MAKPTRIVILGGGFAGTGAALRLERLFRRDDSVEIVLVDAENFFVFTPLLPEVPSGSLQPKHIVFPHRALLRKTKVRQAEIRAIDLDRRFVVASHCQMCGNFEVPFDHLVLAFGAVPNFFGLPGVAENALTIKSLADATALHAHVVDKLEHADLQDDADLRRELLTFVVAGGGFAGVETIAELNDFVRACGRYYPRVQPEEPRLVLVQSGQRILPEVSEKLSAYALRKLRQRGVEVVLEARVKECTATEVRLSNGDLIRTRTLVWSAGLAPCQILASVDLPKNAGKIQVEQTLQVKDRPGIWALGDCAAVPDLVPGKSCPPTAQHAIRQGRLIADNIAAAIKGAPPVAFHYKPLGLMAGLGRRSAVAEILGFRFSGFVAWWLWRSIYLSKLPGWERKIRVALDWTLDLFFPRDIVFLRPLYTAHGHQGAVDIRPEAVVAGTTQAPNSSPT